MASSLSKEARELHTQAVDFDGIEVPQEWWDFAQELVDAGVATLSGPRGPGQRWKRLEPLYEPVPLP